MSLAAFTERYRKWCKRYGYNFSQSKAVEVHTGAQDLIAMLPQGRSDQNHGPAGH